VILVNGTRSHTEALREDVAAVLAPLGLRLSPAKTQVVHMSHGLSFLGFRIRWKRKKGSGKWYVYTFVADRPVRALKAKIRALTRRTSQQDLAHVLTRLGQIMRGWANYFKYAVAKWTFSKLDAFTWWRLARMLRARHRWNWGQLRRHLTPQRRRRLSLPAARTAPPASSRPFPQPGPSRRSLSRELSPRSFVSLVH
jgi:RNA-directed DNA polymerase